MSIKIYFSSWKVHNYLDAFQLFLIFSFVSPFSKLLKGKYNYKPIDASQWIPRIRPTLINDLSTILAISEAINCKNVGNLEYQKQNLFGDLLIQKLVFCGSRNLLADYGSIMYFCYFWNFCWKTSFPLIFVL